MGSALLLHAAQTTVLGWKHTEENQASRAPLGTTSCEVAFRLTEVSAALGFGSIFSLTLVLRIACGQLGLIL